MNAGCAIALTNRPPFLWDDTETTPRKTGKRRSAQDPGATQFRARYGLLGPAVSVAVPTISFAVPAAVAAVASTAPAACTASPAHRRHGLTR